ncbi:hypothetical protein E3P91_02172 [Wallemia ichthyophaga]|nr:hypothetical protein E3P91_02172 [Wallemia ichthyophaga]
MDCDISTYPPHPILQTPKLCISGLRSHTITSQEIASQLVGCLPVRVVAHTEQDAIGIPIHADVQFKQLYSAEKALTIYPQITFPEHETTLGLLPYDSQDQVAHIPPPPATTPRFFRNLPQSITPNEVYDLCRTCGPLYSIKMVNSGVAVVWAWDESTSLRLEEDLHCTEYENCTISVTKYDSSKESSHLHPKAAAFVPNTHSNTTTGLHTPYTPSYFGHGPGQQVQYTGSNLIDPCNLFVKNLDHSLASNDLFDAFKSFGHIVSARVMRDENDQSRGFGFVSYQSPESAKAALHVMNGVGVRTKAITVRFHEPKQLRQEKLAARFSKNDRLGVSSPVSPIPSDYGMNSNLNSPPLSATPSMGGGGGGGVGVGVTVNGRRGSGSYFKAALSAHMAPSLGEFKTMTASMRSEMLGGHLLRSLHDVGVSDIDVVDAVDRLISTYGLDNLVECLHNRDALLRCYKGTHGAPVEAHLNALRIDNSVVGSSTDVITPASEESGRLIIAVQNLGERDYKKIGEMLGQLGKKERAMCLFSNEYLIQKVRDAKVLVEVECDNEKDAKDEKNKEGGNDEQMRAQDALKMAVNEMGLLNEDIYRHTQDWFEGLQGLESKKQKQKIGERLFKKIKAEGIKGNTAKITVKLLDNEDLYSSEVVYDSLVKEVLQRHETEIEDGLRGLKRGVYDLGVNYAKRIYSAISQQQQEYIPLDDEQEREQNQEQSSNIAQLISSYTPTVITNQLSNQLTRRGAKTDDQQKQPTQQTQPTAQTQPKPKTNKNKQQPQDTSKDASSWLFGYFLQAWAGDEPSTSQPHDEYEEHGRTGPVELFHASTTDLTHQLYPTHSQATSADLKWWKLTLPAKLKEKERDRERDRDREREKPTSSPINPMRASSDSDHDGSASPSARIGPSNLAQLHDQTHQMHPPRSQLSSFDDSFIERPSTSSQQHPTLRSHNRLAKKELDNAALYRRRKLGRRTKKDKLRKFLLHSAYVPLLFRSLNLGFTTATLAVCIRLRLLEGRHGVVGISGAGAIIGIIFAPMTLTHVMVSIYLEYFYGRPIGIWGIRSKMAHTLLDLVFICFWSAELSLVFDNYFTSLLSCSTKSAWWSNVTQANERTTDSLINEIEQGTMCNYLGALIGLVFVGMVLYLVNLIVSLYRIYERVRLHQVLYNESS